MQTIFEFSLTDIDCNSYDYKYQPEQTEALDLIDTDFNQEIINQIVLWKVNRYAPIDVETMKLINRISKKDTEIDIALLGEIFLHLLHYSQKGIRLAMVSTILRFKNPKVYQIIDQRVYRFLFGKELKYDLKDINMQICLYTDYLDKMKEACQLYNVEFENADRVFFAMDKKFNKDIKLNGY
ncbi:MAG: hypothetical protein Q7U47_10575 [Paludibacter sp.]|nr:hypothetical protein [Paludibacter sp.]